SAGSRDRRRRRTGPQLLEPLEPLERDLLRAERAVRLSGLGVAVPIAAARAEQAESQRDAGEARAEIGVVTRMPDFHGVQPLALQALEKGARPPLLEMGHRDDPTHAVHRLGHLAERR